MKTIKKSLISLVTAFASIGAFAQTWSTYSRTDTNANVTPAAMTEDGDGYVYVVGTTPGSGKNMVVLKFSSGGSLIDSVEVGSSEREEGYDITMGPDGKLYALGKFKDVTNSYKPKFLVVCMTTGLSVSWQYSVTAYEPDGTTESNDILPYRIVTGGSSGSPYCYITGQVNDTGIENAIDLYNPTHAKAVFYAKVNSSGVSWWGAWDGLAAFSDQLFGAHTMSNGLLFVTSTSYNISGTYYPRTTYTKIDNSGSVAWSVKPTTISPDGTHTLAQSAANGDVVYTSLHLVPTSGIHIYDYMLGLDGSATSAPSGGDWTLGPFEMYTYIGFTQIYDNIGLGVGYWNGGFYGVGKGVTSITDPFGGPMDHPEWGSWLRSVGGSVYDSGADTSDSLTARRYVPEPNQRCVDAYNGRLLGLARGTSSTTFWSLTQKVGSGRSEGTTTLTSGYTTTATNPGPLQVLASKQSNTLYVLLNVDNGSSERLALYKFDR